MKKQPVISTCHFSSNVVCFSFNTKELDNSEKKEKVKNKEKSFIILDITQSIITKSCHSERSEESIGKHSRHSEP